MAKSSRSGAPDRYRTDVILRDGSTLYLRPIRRDDDERLLDFFQRLSPHTVYLRFHHRLKQMSREEVERYCTVDYENTFALVATLGEDLEERIIAVCRYYRLPRVHVAEVAVVVDDAHQGKGIGTHLLEHLAAIAREKGIRVFEAEVLAENAQMMKVLMDSGFQVIQELEHDVYRIALSIAPTPAAEERSAEREKIATIASLRSFLKPRSIAVIGASQNKDTIGNRLFRNILHHGFDGVVYPVNPNAQSVAAVKAYPSILDIPDEVDLAVVMVPSELVNTVVQQCGRKGVAGIVVISAGFGESGPEGMEMQEKLIEITRSYGMRLVGPNCMGIINNDPGVSMNATFSSISPPAGNIALCSQSGALGLAVLEYARTLNVGLSIFASIGNRADVSSNDLLQYLEEDPSTDVILLYLESFGNPRKFARIARNVTGRKPVVAVKSGRTPAGSRAAASHTGALATAEVASEAMFRQAGIIRVDTMEELFDVANLLSHQPLPRGRRLAILTNGGGPAIMTADACVSRGLELSSLSDSTVSGLRKVLPRGACLTNPVDMTAEADAAQYGGALRILAEDDGVDIIVVIFVPPIITKPEEVAGAIQEVIPQFRRHGKTIIASFMGSRNINLDCTEYGYIPNFTFPEAVSSALAKACEYSEWLERPRGTVPTLKGIEKKEAAQIVESALKRRKTRPLWLDAPAVEKLLDSYGIRTVRSETAASAGEAVRAAAEIGFPVVLKLLSDTIIHKTEVGGVILDLRSKKEVTQAFRRIKSRMEDEGKGNEMQGVVVQQMVEGGVEVIAGVTQDPSFGPLILFGMGGVYAELLKDITFRIHPLTNIDAREMPRSVKAYRLLEGWRGSPPCDVKAVEGLLLRVSAMIEDLPQIAELDLNPVKVLEGKSGCVVVDARIMLE